MRGESLVQKGHFEVDLMDSQYDKVFQEDLNNSKSLNPVQPVTKNIQLHSSQII